MAGSGIPAAFGPPTVRGNNVVIGGGSLASSPFGANTTLIRVHTDAICSFVVGAPGVTALATDSRMVAGQTEYFAVAPGEVIATITNS